MRKAFGDIAVFNTIPAMKDELFSINKIGLLLLEPLNNST